MLYRIDGVPISIRVPGYREQLLGTMFWLEKHIRHVLGEMNREGLKETIFISGITASLLLLFKIHGPCYYCKAEANQQLISLERLGYKDYRSLCYIIPNIYKIKR